MNKLLVAASALLMLGSLASCEENRHELSPAAERIKRQVEAHLAVGDSDEVLLAYFRRERWPPGYDDFLRTYFTSFTVETRFGVPTHSVIVWIAMDSQKRVKKIRYEDIYPRR
jgi:hypothetical protein